MENHYWDYNFTKEVEYQDGMIPCSCGCNNWGFLIRKGSEYYVPGHYPSDENTEEIEEVTYSTKEPSRFLRDAKWLLPIVFIVGVISVILGWVAEIILK